MVDVGRQEETVRAVQPLVVGRITPRFDVAGFEMTRVIHQRHATAHLMKQDVRPENALAPASLDDLFSERRPNQHPINVEFVVHPTWRMLDRPHQRPRIPVGLSDHRDQSVGQGFRNLGQVHGLQTITVRSKRRVLGRAGTASGCRCGPSAELGSRA